MKPIIGITIGDPAGIGPEIVCKTLLDREIYHICRPVLIGSSSVINRVLATLNIDLKVQSVIDPRNTVFEYGLINIIDIPLDYDYSPGELKTGNGKSALEYIYKSVELIKNGLIDAISTAPTNKEAMKMAGSTHAGATELFAHLANVKEFSTIIKQGKCYIFQLTTHISLRDAINKINKEFLYNEIKKANDELILLGLKKPKIGLSGLNPHAGEGGLLGNEEIEIFEPVVRRLKSEGIDISDPLPADSIFFRGYNGTFDAIIMMYHDAANIAIKLMSNSMPTVVITGGLPFVRTTVAHGTAYDIAYKGIADYQQMKQAIVAASEIFQRKTHMEGD